MRVFLSNVEYYFTLEQKHLVLIYYKCIVHSSRLKTNAEYLVQHKVSEVLLKFAYPDDV